MDVDFKVIGERVVEIRKRLNYLQKDFAKEMEIAPSSLCDIEAGNIKPRFELLFNITKKFNVNVSYLFHGAGDMFLSDQGDLHRELKQLTADEMWFNKFLYHFRNSPFTRYHVMTEFRSFTVQNAELIKRDIEAHLIETGQSGAEGPQEKE